MNVDAPEKPVEAPEATLTANDRCDRCGAQAYVQVLLETGDLLFCNHDWMRYQEKLSNKAVKIVDETWRLTQ